MEGSSLPRCRMPRVVRSFVPTRLTDELLAEVYERLLAVAVGDAAGCPSQAPEAARQPLPCGRGQLLTTGGRT
jgi:hypothetical protein